MDTRQLIDAAEKLFKFNNYLDFNSRGYSAKSAKAHAALDAHVLQWKEWLRESYGADFTDAQHDVVFRQAWNTGSWRGYKEVESAYKELTSFLAFFNAAT